MKRNHLISLLFAIIFTQFAFAQQKIYLNNKGEQVDSTAEYSKCIELTTQPNGWIFEKQFDENGFLNSEGAYSTYNEEEKIAEGVHRHNRYESEDLWYIELYENGQLVRLESFYPGGKLKREEVYKKGEFKKGKCFDEDGSKRPFTRFFVHPEFPGGEREMLYYLASNIKYPSDARENNIEGVVALTFVLAKDGAVSDVQVIKGVGGGCSQEAVRVVRAMPKWSPMVVDDKPVKVRFTLPVRFKLE